MRKSPNIIKKLTCSNGSELDISQSNEKSQIIKVVYEINDDPQKERFYDTLLENNDALKLFTNPVIDMGKTDNNAFLYLFSSPKLEMDPDDGKESRTEHSKQCMYRLDSEIRSLAPIMSSYQQMLTSGTSSSILQENLLIIQKKSKDILFQSNEMYGYSIDDQLSKGFSDKNRLISNTQISHDVYEDIINTCLRAGICIVFQHICWCKRCKSNTYAILIHGHNALPKNIECPICNEPLYFGRFICLLPDFEPLLELGGGFIPPLIGWHLTKKEFEWTADVTIDQHEYADILLKRNNQYYLIESKIWSREIHERGLNGNIKRAIDQAINHVKFWEGKNIKINKVAIITNQFDGANFQRCIESSLKEKAQMIGEIKIKVYHLKQISTFITELIGE